MTEIYKPGIGDMWFREQMLADEETSPTTTLTAARSRFPRKDGRAGMITGW